ncbi:MAG TPA: aminotransferase class I/II-fold pyridoxal phosphate-dependent enzyme [Gemmatimonadaceae bacterium]|nr:aminotransferase class I/II-fold pyridoxal phosphate-dependent enzyme [Gemmatimonadaceae bacterium]
MTAQAHDAATIVAENGERAGAEAAPRFSTMAEGLTGSEILRIAADIRAMVARGESVCNLTVGDFSPKSFPIPEGLRERIVTALQRGETNYPPSNGVAALREAVCQLYERMLGLHVTPDRVIIGGGSRPGIYATYRTLVDPGDRVVFPAPSWNNNHYCHLVGARKVEVPCDASTGFLPTREMLAPLLRGARLLALNSPLNPAGTAFDADALAGICDLVLEENERRGTSERPLFLMYDQVYWMLTYGIDHVDPIRLRPAMEQYTVLIDGISKAFASTGLRVGWTVAPADVAPRLSDVVGHMGAWAPRAEQVATAEFLRATEEVEEYRDEIRRQAKRRLDALVSHLSAWREAGLPVDFVSPQGAIYLSARFALAGRRTPSGETLRDTDDVRRWLLREAGLAVVPFQAFGVAEADGWCRLSVGAVTVEEIEAVMPRVRAAIESVTKG